MVLVSRDTLDQGDYINSVPAMIFLRLEIRTILGKDHREIPNGNMSL